MFRPQKPPRWYVQRDIQILVRSFPSEHIRITRRGAITSVSASGQPNYAITVVFEGEALVAPHDGTLERIGIGQIEQDNPVLLVPGFHKILQGDFLLRGEPEPDGSVDTARLYVVTFNANAWHAFSVVTMRNYRQGT